MNDAREKKRRVPIEALAQHAMALAAEHNVEPSQPLNSERNIARCMFKLGWRITKADRQTKVAASWQWAREHSLAWTKRMEKVASNSIKARALRNKSKALEEKKAGPLAQKIETPKIDPLPLKPQNRSAPKRAKAREISRPPFLSSLEPPFARLPSASVILSEEAMPMPYDHMNREQPLDALSRAVALAEAREALRPLVEAIANARLREGDEVALLDVPLAGKPLGSLTLAELLSLVTQAERVNS
jgi:hypothetical protein